MDQSSDKAAGQQKHVSELKLHASELEHRNAYLQEQLLQARRKPMRMLKNKILFSILRLLSKASPPLSFRTIKRIERSALKRDPRRNDFALVPQIDSFQTTYQMVLAGWKRQRAAQHNELQRLLDSVTNGPLISVVIPVCNPSLAGLKKTIESVLSQSYKTWDLYLADDCSDQPVHDVLAEYAAKYENINVTPGKKNEQATNLAIAAAAGDFMLLLGHEDVLDPDALLYVAEAIHSTPEACIFYSDEDKVRPDGTRFDPHFKPDWNRDLLYGMNYVSHLCAYKTDLLRSVGGLRTAFEGAQDYDLLLRCVEQADDSQIVHIPKVLYSHQFVENGTATDRKAKATSGDYGLQALSEHIERMYGGAASVEPGPLAATYRVNWPVPSEPLVSIVLPTRDRLDLTQTAVDSVLTKTAYSNFELIIVDNGSVEQDTLNWFGQVERLHSNVRVLRDERPFNYSALNNAAVSACSGEMIALLNNDIEVINSDWLTEMVSLAQRPGTGCVGAKLYFPDGRIQHGGVLLGFGGIASHSHMLFPKDHPGYFARLVLRQNLSAVTAACLVVRRDVYESVGGLNETDLAVAFNDVDFCLKVQAAGYQNVWTPWAELVHHESASRGFEDTAEKKERFRSELEYMQSTWKTDSVPDPAYNVNLSLDRPDFSCAPPNWTP